MENWVGIGVLAGAPALADADVSPTGTNLALGLYQELDLPIQIPAEIPVGSYQAVSPHCPLTCPSRWCLEKACVLLFILLAIFRVFISILCRC